MLDGDGDEDPSAAAFVCEIGRQSTECVEASNDHDGGNVSVEEEDDFNDCPGCFPYVFHLVGESEEHVPDHAGEETIVEGPSDENNLADEEEVRICERDIDTLGERHPPVLSRWYPNATQMIQS